MKIYTSDEILEDPSCTQDLDKIKYKLTYGEIQWLDFIRGRYSIADYLIENLEINSMTDADEYVVTINYMDMSESLYKDTGNYPKAVMLSDESALQHIFFYNFIEQEEKDEDS